MFYLKKGFSLELTDSVNYCNIFGYIYRFLYIFANFLTKYFYF